MCVCVCVGGWVGAGVGVGVGVGVGKVECYKRCSLSGSGVSACICALVP